MCWFRIPIGLIGLAVLLVSGCAPVSLTGTWKDPDYSAGQIEKVLVIGITENDLNRRMFEDRFVSELKLLGVDARTSYPVVPCEKACSKESIAKELKDKGLDGVVVTRVVDSRLETQTSPERVIVEPDPLAYGYRDGYYRPHVYYRDWYPYYSRSVEITRIPAETTQVRVLTLETNLYATATDKLVWSAQSEVEAQAPTQDLINSFIKVVIEAMQRENVF